MTKTNQLVGTGSQTHPKGLTINCPLDQGKDFSVISRLQISGELFVLSRCRSCGLVMLNPQPDSETLNQFYQTDYYGEDNQKFIRFIQFLRTISVQKKIRSIERYYKQHAGSVMDIGSGDGSFLFNLKKRKWNTTGLEISENFRASAFLQDINVFIGDIGGHDFPDNSYNVVTLWHVFEHLDDPERYLSEIR